MGGVISKIKKKILYRIDAKVGSILRARYQSFTVTRPYKIVLEQNSLLKGQVAVVTGGSGAIGRACCVRLAAEGAKVYVCCSRQGNASCVVDEIRQLGFAAEEITLNVLNSSDIEKTFQTIASNNGGRIDILVNSAGGSAREEANNIVSQSVEVIDRILNVNLRGAILCCQAASKYMVKQRSGRLINITSVIGLQGKAGFSEYAASKGGSIAFVKSLAQELGRYGITVNGVAPGIVQRGSVNEQMIERLSKTNWLNSYGKPEDISEMVAYLCSSKASFITGQNIAIDGGRSLGLKEN